MLVLWIANGITGDHLSLLGAAWQRESCQATRAIQFRPCVYQRLRLM